MGRLTCGEFERLWNESLDARGEVPISRQLDAIEAHAAECSRCRALGERYRTLNRALARRVPLPGPSDDLTERILAAWARESPSAAVLRRRSPVPGWWSAAAAAVALIALGFLVSRSATRIEPDRSRQLASPALVPPPIRLTPGPLELALSEATAATLELALETSAPAARVGRGMLTAAASGVEVGTATPEIDITNAKVLESVSDGLSRGVRPISGPARHAFRFLVPSNLGG